jgi:ribosomal protein S18 acetylase RimI-like enzyme
LAADLLWVRHDLRGRGYGKRLLQAAEAEAVKRGCRHALLDTMSFQAPEIYERQGYGVYGVLDDFPGEHQRRYYRKDLDISP